MRYLAMAWAILGSAFLLASAASAQATQPTTSPAGVPGRERLSLDRGWLFHLGDVPFPVVSGQGESYNNAKAGTAGGAAGPDFDDSQWRRLDLPHDWAVEGPFDPKANIAQGYRPRGTGWYRRFFKLDPADHGRHLELQFDGVATFCTVWVNGMPVHRNWCGYTSFSIDVTPFARFGDDVNTVVVRVDADAQEGWWYEGAGIYRHTWLVKRDAVHIATDGVFANPVRLADGSWSVPIEVTLGSTAAAGADVDVESTLLDADGNEVTKAATSARVEPFAAPVVKLPLAVKGPKLWSVDEPTLYSVRTTVRRGGTTVDQATTRCGFRTIRFDPNEGFFLNDAPLKLKGVCNHQDHAGVGVAVPDALWDFRIRKLKEMGVNAYRSAHNPPAAEFLDACDRLGLLVMDENRNFNTTPEYARQLEWMVRRDRNHPGIILWSVFNEEPMQGSPQGYEMVRQMSAIVKTLDVTRPVTAAQSNSMLNDVNASLAADVAGFNYNHREYDRYHALHPDKPMTSSEDTSAVMTRGEYTTDKARALIASYDTEFQPWGRTHHEGWKWIAERPFVAGGFVWTGFDYRGEPQPLVWPAIASSFGIMDLCGFPKSAYYIHQSQWVDAPMVQLVPHWNWAGSEGKPIQVMAITNADTVTLSLNGRSIGSKPVARFELVSWDVQYEAGKLEAVATRDGKEVARCVVETTGAAAALELIPDRPSLAGDGRDALPVTVRALDAQGRPVPTANLPVKFELVGPGAIIGLGNGDPLCHEPEKGNARSLFNGLAQVIVQTAQASSGELKLRATADGLKPAEVALAVTPAAPEPQVPAAKPTQVVGRWRMSPPSMERPDPNVQVARNDQNTWSNVQPGTLPPLTGGRFAIVRATFRPRATVRRTGGTLTLHDVVGRAEVYVDGQRVVEKSDATRADVAVPIPAGEGEHVVSILIEAEPGTKAGLGGAASVD